MMNEKHADVIKNYLSEYLDTFLILGFEPDGTPIQLVKAESIKDDLALEYLRRNDEKLDFEDI